MFAAAPAGGAQLGQIAIVVGFVSVAYAFLLLFALAHRAGRRTRIAAFSESLGRLVRAPAWAALPLGVAAVSLSTVYTGLMWDMSLHIDQGRDAGPLANPAHYFILLGLYGIFAAGFLTLVLAGWTGPRAREASRGATTPVELAGESRPGRFGGILLAAAGTFALIGFPLDDVWHRLFGQDVTLWGPTHLIMLGGGVLSTVGVAVLLAEAGTRWRGTRVIACAALLVGLSSFMGEFDFGVPQFRLVLQPALLAFAAGVALVAARRWAGPGGALAAAVVALILGYTTSLFVHVAGEAAPAVPLFVPEGIAIELAFLARRGPLTAGALAGTLGFAGEWAWTHVAMPIAWTSALLPEGLIMAVAAGIAGAVIGGELGGALNREPPRRWAAIASLAVFAAVLANGLIERTPEARVTLTRNAGGLTARVDPAGLGDDAIVRYVAWQGKAPREQATLTRVAPGVFHTPDAIPTTGEWKSLLLLYGGRTLVAAPIYEPADSAIPVEEVPARAQVTRPLEKTRTVLQRERKAGVPTWLWTSASLVVLVLSLAFLALLGWGVDRFARASSSTARTSPSPRTSRFARPRSLRSPAGT
jgi:hypothetical protein